MKILLATDGSYHARNALDLLKRKPFVSSGSEVRVLVVVPEEKPSEQATVQEAETVARAEAQRFQDVGFTVHTTVRKGHAADCIIHAAVEFGTELVVMGSRGPTGAKRLLLGSVSQKTMKNAQCSVLVVRSPNESAAGQGARERTPLRVLVAFDGSPSALAAVEDVASLQPSEDMEITVVTVLPLTTYFRADIIQTESPEYQQRKEAAQADLESVAHTLGRATPHVAATLRQGGDEAEEILKVADELGTDVIVLGHKGKSAIKRLLLGSVSNRVSHHAKCSVWIVRKPEHV